MMYDRYQGLIFDIDGTILDTELTHHRKAWHEVMFRYGMTFDEAAMVALSGSPSWHIAQAIIASPIRSISIPIIWPQRSPSSGRRENAHARTHARTHGWRRCCWTVCGHCR